MSSALPTDPIQALLDILQPVHSGNDPHSPQPSSASSSSHLVPEQQQSAITPQQTPSPSSTATSQQISNLLASLHSVSSSSITAFPSPTQPSLSTQEPSMEQEYDPTASYTPLASSSHHHYKPHPTSYRQPSPYSAAPPPPTKVTPPADLSDLTFAQSLPHLVTLSSSPSFVSSLRAFKASQDTLERKLFQEREAIIREHRKGVEKAKVTAEMVGLHKGVPEFERKVLADKLELALRRFAAERVLPAWDAEIRSQRSALAALGVPTMGAAPSGTSDRGGGTDLRDRQRRVVGALEGMME